MSTENDYPTVECVDLAIRRAALRRKAYRDQGLTVSVEGQTHVIDRLLDRRLVLMGERS